VCGGWGVAVGELALANSSIENEFSLVIKHSKKDPKIPTKKNCLGF
jgi:hypothetical protein